VQINYIANFRNSREQVITLVSGVLWHRGIIRSFIAHPASRSYIQYHGVMSRIVEKCPCSDIHRDVEDACAAVVSRFRLLRLEG